MQERVTQGQSVAVISNSDTALTLASGASPWLRYSPVMPTIMKKSQLIQSNRVLSEAGANVVFIQHELDDDLDFTLHPTDVWKGFQKTLRKLYRFHHRCGPFEVWERIRN